MASTYSTSLRLELMATGDQSGTWGTTTNTNLGTLLEQSITGVLSVAQGDVANLTLTTVNGGTDQARNAVVNITGALTAARNVVVQTANKLYLIKNSTTGGFSLTAKTAAGTGVVIPPLSSQWVYSDGTNVVAGLIGNMPFNNLLQGYTTTATAAGTTVLDVTSTHTQYFTGATTQTITLPVVSTLILGQEFEIVNLSSGSLTVNSSGANLVATVLAGGTLRVQVILITGTSAASWNTIVSSVPNPLTLSGSSVAYTPLLLTSTEAAAAAGPIEDNYRDSASPAANDILGQYIFNGRDSAANKQEYASIQAVIVSPTSTTEASTLDFYTQKGGSRVLSASLAGPVANFTSVAEGYTTTATAAGTTTLTVSSTQLQYFTGSTTQTVVLPVASTLVLGQTFTIFNNSTGLVTVQSSGANTIQIMGGTLITYAPGAPGTKLICTCILTSGTGTASWAFEYVTPTTQWVAYTPTFTGFGTAAGVSFFSRRVGPSLEVIGSFTNGTTSATVGQITVGFNGTSANITINATSVPGIRLVGTLAVANSAPPNFVLANASNTFVQFGGNGGGTGLTPLAVNGFLATGIVAALQFSVPLTGG